MNHLSYWLFFALNHYTKLWLLFRTTRGNSRVRITTGLMMYSRARWTSTKNSSPASSSRAAVRNNPISRLRFISYLRLWS